MIQRFGDSAILRFVRRRAWVSWLLEVAGVGGLAYSAWVGIAPVLGVTLASVYLIILGNLRR